MEFDQEFVEFVAKAIVNHPTDVWVERTVDSQGVLLVLHVNPEDMGHVIGGKGATADAFRTMLRPIAAKSNTRIGFRIHDASGRGFGEKKVEGAAPAVSAPQHEEAPVPRRQEDMDTTQVDSLTF